MASDRQSLSETGAGSGIWGGGARGDHPAERGQNTNFVFLPGEEIVTHAISRAPLLEGGPGSLRTM